MNGVQLIGGDTWADVATEALTRHEPDTLRTHRRRAVAPVVQFFLADANRPPDQRVQPLTIGLAESALDRPEQLLRRDVEHAVAAVALQHIVEDAGDSGPVDFVVPGRVFPKPASVVVDQGGDLV